MSTYSYSPFLRVMRPAGDPIVYDLGAIERMSIAQWIADPIFTQKETVRRRLRNIKYGWRLQCVFEWVIDPGSASELTLVDLGYWVNRNDASLEMHMSGLLIVSREVVLSAWSRSNVDNKNIFGLYHAEFTCVDLLSEDSVPPEFVQSPPALGQWHG